MKKHSLISLTFCLSSPVLVIQSAAQDPNSGHPEPEVLAESVEDPDQDLVPGVAPCGHYDPEKLERHYLVEFARSTTDNGKTKVEINTVAPSGPSDRRKVFPRERMALILRDEKNEALLETPVLWRKREISPLDSSETYQLTVEFDSSLADRLCLSSMNSVVFEHSAGLWHHENILVLFEPFHFRSGED